MTAGAGRVHGLVVATHGRQVIVAADSGERVACVARGRTMTAVCGDRVWFTPTATGQGVIDEVTQRASLLWRSDAHREKAIAANVDQMLFVVAGRPSFSDELLTRALMAAESAGLTAIILLNKCDLADAAEVALAQLAPFVALGYPVLRLAAKTDVAPLAPRIAGRTSVLVGQSGMGKSTIVNALVPGAAAATAEVSDALDSGRHTTTHARLHRIDAATALIDSPGLQVFGLRHLGSRGVDAAMREFRPLLGRCRYADCSHRDEPGCVVTAALARGEIDARRHAVYRRVYEENLAAERSLRRRR